MPTAERLAADAAELARWKGQTLLPRAGCHFAWMPLGKASVLVEYEFEAAERRTFDHPGTPANAMVVAVLINGALFDPEGLIDQGVIDGWELAIAESHGADLRVAA